MFSQTWGWWLACEVIALVFLPLMLRWFRALPDRGIGLAPAMGILVTTYTAWLWSFKKSGLAILAFLLLAALMIALGLWLEGQKRGKWRFGCYAMAALPVLSCIPWSHGAFAIAFAVLVWAGVGAAFWWEDYASLWRAFKSRWPLWITVQILFTVGFLFFSNVRSYIPWASYEPGMSGAEKFDNLAHLNSCMRATTMPPTDAWWAGKSINYYYGGHLVSATVAKLVGQPAAIAFNLGLAMVFALSLTSGFSLTFNVVNRFARLWRPHWGDGWKVLRTPLWVKGMGWGLLGAVAVALFGNLDPWTQILSRESSVVRPTYDRLYGEQIKIWKEWNEAVEKAEKGKDKIAYERLMAHPVGIPPSDKVGDLTTRLSWPNLLNVDFWRSSRMLKGSITEFPYFSAILGDHHAHHYALPFCMIALTAVAGLLRKGARWKGKERAVLKWLTAAWPELLAMAAMIGMILPINAWDVVVLIPLYLLAVFVAMTGLVPEKLWRWVTTLGAYGAGMMILALFLNARPGMLHLVQTPITVAIPILLLGLPIAIEEFRPGTVKLWMRAAILAGFVFILSVAAAVTGKFSASDAFLILTVVGAVALWQIFCDGRLYRWWGAAIAIYGVVGVLGLTVGLPFKLFFHSPFDTQAPLLISKFPPALSPDIWTAPEFWQTIWSRLPVNPTGIAPIRSQLRDYIGHWGLFWIPIIVLWIYRLATEPKRWPKGKGFALWAGLFCLLYLTFDLIKNSWVAPITLMMCAGSLVLAFSRKRDPRSATLWSFLSIAFFYSFFVEVLHFDDRYSGELERYNTPFKIYYPLWAPMAVGMCVMLKELVARRPPSTSLYPRPWLRMAPWVGIATLLVIAILLSKAGVFLPVFLLALLFAVVFAAALVIPSLRPRNATLNSILATTSDLFSRLAWRVPLLLCVGFIVMLGMLYPVATTAGRTNWFQNPKMIPSYQKDSAEKNTYTERTLDSTAYLGNKPQFADDYKVIQWINENVEGSPVIVERNGDGAYQPGSRFATNTGIPTVLGWEHHELQWRGWGASVSEDDIKKYGDELVNRAPAPKPGEERRVEMVQLTGLLRVHLDTIYKSRSYEEIKHLLDLHEVRYIVVGSLEREAYKDSPEGLKKFDNPPFTVAFQSGSTTLYEYKVPR